jgi:hypothetical protein
MRLNEIKGEEVIWEDTFGGETYRMTLTPIEEGVQKMAFGKSKGGKMIGSGLAAMGNPKLAGMMAGLAVAAFKKHQQNRRNITRFYAKGSRDEQFYDKVVDDLMASNNYRKVKKQRITGGGVLWELERIKTS